MPLWYSIHGPLWRRDGEQNPLPPRTIPNPMPIRRPRDPSGYIAGDHTPHPASPPHSVTPTSTLHTNDPCAYIPNTPWAQTVPAPQPYVTPSLPTGRAHTRSVLPPICRVQGPSWPPVSRPRLPSLRLPDPSTRPPRFRCSAWTPPPPTAPPPDGPQRRERRAQSDPSDDHSGDCAECKQ